MPPAVEAWSLNHWTAGKSLSLFFIGKTEEQKSSVAFTGSYSQYVTVYTELCSLHRNQGYRLFHNLFLPRTHAHTHAHTHTHRGFFIMPSFPFSHICLSLTPYLTLKAWTPWAHQHILLDLQRGILYVFYSQELLWGNEYYSRALLHVSYLPISSSSDTTDSANISQELTRVGAPLGPSSCVSGEQGLQESTHSLSCAPKLCIQELWHLTQQTTAYPVSKLTDVRRLLSRHKCFTL